MGFEEHNLELADDFMATLPPLSESRLLKYRTTLNKMSRDFGKAFDALTQADLREYIEGVGGRGDYSDWTKQDYRQLVRKFFGWLRDPGFVGWGRSGAA